MVFYAIYEKDYNIVSYNNNDYYDTYILINSTLSS